MGLPQSVKKVQNTSSSFQLSKPVHDGLGKGDGWMKRSNKSHSLAVSMDYTAKLELWKSLMKKSKAP